MRQTLNQVVALVLILASAALLHGQNLPARSGPGVPTHSLRVLGIAKAQERAQAMVAEAADELSKALEVAVQFLQLRPDQIEKLRQQLQARQQAVAPLLAGIAEREKRLGELLESGGSPPEVGQPVIEIHTLQKQIAQAQQQFLANWENLLDPEQRQRLEGIRLATRLQPIVPAFQRLQLL